MRPLGGALLFEGAGSGRLAALAVVVLLAASARAQESPAPTEAEPRTPPVASAVDRYRLGVTMGAESARTGRWQPPTDAREIGEPTAEQIERGGALYAGGTCATCHNHAGRGTSRGPALDDAVWLHGDGSLAAIRAVIASGVPRSEHRGRQTPYEMRPFGGMELDPTELDTLSAYVWSLSRGVSVSALLAPGTPAGESDPVVRVAFGSCAHQDEQQPIWDDVLASDPDLFLLLGDNVYADTLDDAARRAAYAKLAEKPGFAELRRRVPVLATWDDHDYGTDDVGAEFPEKEASRRAFLDFLTEPRDSARWHREGVYAAYRFGPGGRVVQVLLLDTRWSRSALRTVADGLDREEARERALARRRERRMGPYEPDPDRAAAMLGEEQWAWLEEQLREPAQVRLIVTSVPFAMELTGWEAWANFPHERRRLISLIVDTGAQGVVFLSGDTHWAELSVIDEGALGAPYALWDLTSSGLTEEWQEVSPNRRRVAGPHVGANFGVVEVEWPASGVGGPEGEIGLLLQVRGLGGEVVVERRVSVPSTRAGIP